MASVTPRASGFWADAERARMSYFDRNGDVEDGIEFLDDEFDDRTALDKTIDRIGMGPYQWALVSLCGFGWLADNMWLQAAAIILPRVQQHYSVPDNYIGTLNSSMFAGMMFGAVGWGTCSDLMGRSTAFNATLFFTSIFGVLSSFTTSFWSLCLMFFFLGSSVGGSMPTDGTLLLEHMPQGKQYLVTALSVFFSFGSVVAAVVALIVVPQNSCIGNTPCNVDTENNGWKYLLMACGGITLTMFVARMIFFRLHESPRYLVHAGRHQEAIESLQLISRFNGTEILLNLEDIDDHRPDIPPSRSGESAPFLPGSGSNGLADPAAPDPIFSTDAPADPEAPESLPTLSSADLLHDDVQMAKDYSSTSESSTALDGHVFLTPADELPPSGASLARGDASVMEHKYSKDEDEHGEEGGVAEEVEDGNTTETRRPRPRIRLSARSRSSTSSFYEAKRRVGGMLPVWIRRPLWAWLDRIAMVLSPEWLHTTVLMWAVWLLLSLAYTMFNVYLPKLLETSIDGVEGDESLKTLKDTLWNVVIFTLGGCPGAILGAYLVETPLGRRKSLAAMTLITAAFCTVFVFARGQLAVRISMVGISLSSTVMYAVLYGWTPEIFGTKVRGTACGIASALSRIGGMIAPLLGGALLSAGRALPEYTSAGVYVFAAGCVLLLRVREGVDGAERGRRKGGFAH